MKSKIKVVLILAALLLPTSYSGKASATLYCNRPYSELTVNPGRPYNAVGLLNNGCTAFLIDANHIVAAAHCFERLTPAHGKPGFGSTRTFTRTA